MKKLLCLLSVLCVAAGHAQIAVNAGSYAPNYPAKGPASLAINKDTGALLVQVLSGGGGGGDATAANQATGNAALASILAKQPLFGPAGTASADVITVQGAAGMTAVKVDGSAVTQPVSLSGNQAVNVAQFAGATADTNSGNKSAGTLRVVIATDQPQNTTALKVDASATTQPVSGSVSLTTASGALGISEFRTTALTSTAQAVSGAAGGVQGMTLVNVNAVPVYVKFYNTAAGSVTVGTTTVVHQVLVPASDGTTPGQLIVAPTSFRLWYFSAAIAVAAVTGLADNSTTAPATAIYCEVNYN